MEAGLKEKETETTKANREEENRYNEGRGKRRRTERIKAGKREKEQKG